MATKTLAPDVEAMQEQLDQAAAENEVLQSRIRELAGFQAEALAFRDGNQKLQEQVEQMSAERDAAKRDAAQATAAALNAATSQYADASLVDSARKVAEGIKGLLG